MTKLILPPAAAEQHIAVLGKNGSGKTFAVKAVHIEPLLAAGKLVAVVDPTSAWWGLRGSADARGPGFKVLVLGGDHGDLPLPANGGAAVARLIVEQRVPAVMDTGNLTVGERTRWMIDFAGSIYRLNRTPLYLVLDEAHVFAPQGGGGRMDPDVGKMLHAVNQLASGGRSRGIRLTMITQRPQKLHKDALTTADTMIAMRVLAPHDREAVKAWIDGCGDPKQGKDVLDSLAGLQRGEGWVWYPEGGHLLRTRFPAIRTFDSSATPTEGRSAPAPKGAAEIDLTEINKVLAEAVAEAEANDPKRLKAEISRLKAEAARKAPAAPVDIAPQLDAAFRDGKQEGLREGYRDGIAAVRTVSDRLVTLSQATTEHVSDFLADLERIAKRAPAPQATPVVRQTYAKRSTPDIQRPREALQRTPAGQGEPLKAMPRAMLTTLAQHPNGLSKSQILVQTGYRSSGPVSKCFAELARNGWIEADAWRVLITQTGLSALGSYEPLPVGDALREQLLNGSKLAPMEKKMMRAVCDAYPSAIGKGRVLELTGYASSGPVSKAFAHLVALGYCTKDGRGALKAAQELFG